MATSSEKLTTDKGKAIQHDDCSLELTNDDDYALQKMQSLQEFHDDDNLTITEMAMITKNKAQPKTPLKVDADPRKPRGIIIEKRKAPQEIYMSQKKDRKHKHRKHKTTTDQPGHFLPGSDETTQQLNVNTETQLIALTNFKEMTKPGDTYNTHLRVLRSWFGMLYGSDSLPSIAFLALDGNAERREVVPAAFALKWRDKIVEGEAYAVTAISVNIAGHLSRLVEAPHQLTFTDHTQMKQLSDTDIPQKPAYVFTKLHEVPTLLLTENIVRGQFTFKQSHIEKTKKMLLLVLLLISYHLYSIKQILLSLSLIYAHLSLD